MHGDYISYMVNSIEEEVSYSHKEALIILPNQIKNNNFMDNNDNGFPLHDKQNS